MHRASGACARQWENCRAAASGAARARQWLGRAAAQGNAQAEDNLGRLYQTGRGAPQDDVIAYALYNASAAADPSPGNPALAHRARLAAQLDERLLERAQALTRKMRTQGVLQAIASVPAGAHDMPARPARNARTATSARYTAAARSPWPARPAHIAGETTCRTRCVNGSCWRTYDDGRHVFLNVAPSTDPFSGQISFHPPSC